MSEPIKTKEVEYTVHHYVEKEWSYDDLLDLYDETEIIPQLVRRCQESEAQIENLRQLDKVPDPGGYGTEADRKMQAQTEYAKDNPEFDGTDGAHPAWWRGHDHTTMVFCQLVNEILDGKPDSGGVANEPWESLRKRLHRLTAVNAELLAACKRLVLVYGPISDDKHAIEESCAAIAKAEEKP